LLVVYRLEKGDLKLRVRAMEVERQLQRSKLVQKNTFAAVLSCLLLNTALSLATVGKDVAFANPISRGLFVGAAILGVRVPFGIMQVNKLDRYNERFGVRNT
jgi:hypothetical protein